jgi:hypothetical protein
MNDKSFRILSCLGLAVGGVFGIAGTFTPNASLRGLAWGIDGIALVTASALLTVRFFRTGQDLVAAGFLVFAVGQGLVLSVAAMDLEAGVPTFAAGASLWAVALLLVSVPRAFPLLVRLLGFAAAILFAATAAQIFGGVRLLPTSQPLPFFAYPVFVATFVGWIWALLKDDARGTASSR